MFGAIVLALFLIGYGLLTFFGRDVVWGLTEWNNSLRGVASERTDAWEFSTTISGLVLLVVGVGLILFIVSTEVQRNQETADATATASSQLTRLDATYVPIIPALRDDASQSLQKANLREYRLPSNMHVYYGLCSYGGFYVIAGSTPTDEYLYLERSTPNSCDPGGWSVYLPEDLGRSSLGGTWYSTSVLIPEPTELPMTPAATADS